MKNILKQKKNNIMTGKNGIFETVVNGVKMGVDLKNKTIRIEKKVGAIVEEFSPSLTISEFNKLLNDIANENSR